MDMNTNAEGTTMTAQAVRLQAEAERIAKAEGFAILSHDDDWTFFTLDDGQTVNATEGQWPNIKIVGTKVIRTHFDWVRESQRFEGFVS